MAGTMSLFTIVYFLTYRISKITLSLKKIALGFIDAFYHLFDLFYLISSPIISFPLPTLGFVCAFPNSFRW